MDLRLELVPVPVTNIDRAKAFYINRIGFIADHDQRVNDQLRFVQLTPPGSACSIAIGQGITEATPGSSRRLQLVVDDIEQTREDLLRRGLDIGDIEDLAWGRFLYFADPDGNTWNIQEVVGPS